MKKSLLIACLFLIAGVLVVSANNPILKKTKNGKKILVELAIEGSVNLYVHEYEHLKPTIPEDPMESYTEIRRSYYIGENNNETIRELTFANYKDLLTNELTECPKLAENIGKKGYKLTNLDMIINDHKDR